MKALLLAAGYGTRLYPLTKDTPKPLLEVGDKPMMEHILDKVASLERVDEVFVVTNDKFHERFVTWSQHYDAPWPVRILNDGTRENDTRLGAIGDIRFAVDEAPIDDDLLVLAGDNLFDFSLDGMVETFERTGSNVIGVLRFEDDSKLSKYGIVEVDEDGRVQEFVEKPDDPPSDLVSMAMYLFPREKLGLIEQYLESGGNPDEPGWYITWLAENDAVYAHPYEGTWFDIGDKDSLEKANRYVSEQQGGI